jgi:hypothetical protein
MGKVVAGITISVDGSITGPNDGPECGSGVGRERLRYRVFGGPRATTRHELTRAMGIGGTRTRGGGTCLW